MLVGKPEVLGYLPGGLPTGDTGDARKDPWIRHKGGPEAIRAGEPQGVAQHMKYGAAVSWGRG